MSGKAAPLTRELAILAQGSDCPRCRATADEPCKTPWGRATQPHTARVDRAVRQYQQATAPKRLRGAMWEHCSLGCIASCSCNSPCPGPHGSRS